jgi:hypothetical protein
LEDQILVYFWVYPDFSSCIIRLVKNRASGFRSLLPFVDMIFLTAGDLDLPGQFQLNFASFKTLGAFYGGLFRLTSMPSRYKKPSAACRVSIWCNEACFSGGAASSRDYRGRMPLLLCDGFAFA